MTRPFPAKYEGGLCPADCGERIHVGDPVMYDGDDLVHVECAPKPDYRFQLRPEEVVCGTCWLTDCRC